MWRRALISVAAVLTASGTFVAVFMLVLGSIVDLALDAPVAEEPETQKASTSATAKDGSQAEGEIAHGSEEQS